MGGRPRQNTTSLQGAYAKDNLKERVELENKLKGEYVLKEAPDFIKDDLVAVNKYEQLVHELNKAGVLANVDDDLLIVYCDCWSKYVKATVMLTKQNMVEEQTNKLGAITKVQNPYIKIQQNYATQLVKLASLFGMSPADRSKIAHIPTDKNEKVDPLLELLSGLK